MHVKGEKNVYYVSTKVQCQSNNFRPQIYRNWHINVGSRYTKVSNR